MQEEKKKANPKPAHFPCSQHTMTWRACWCWRWQRLLDPVQTEPCGGSGSGATAGAGRRALGGTSPLAAPAAKAAFPSDINHAQIQPLILSPWSSSDPSMEKRRVPVGLLLPSAVGGRGRCCWLRRAGAELSQGPDTCFLFGHVLVQWFEV